MAVVGQPDLRPLQGAVRSRYMTRQIALLLAASLALAVVSLAPNGDPDNHDGRVVVRPVAAIAATGMIPVSMTTQLAPV